MRTELAQARQVLQVILPESRLALPGLVVESEYRPDGKHGTPLFSAQSAGKRLVIPTTQKRESTRRPMNAGVPTALTCIHLSLIEIAYWRLPFLVAIEPHRFLLWRLHFRHGLHHLLEHERGVWDSVYCVAGFGSFVFFMGQSLAGQR